ALGALPVDISKLGADFYTGNLHKWGMAPRPSAILWASPSRQKDLHPTAISWGYGKGMSAEFDMLGTRDASVWLAAPHGGVARAEHVELGAHAFSITPRDRGGVQVLLPRRRRPQDGRRPRRHAP